MELMDVVGRNKEDSSLPKATVTKIIKEILPPDVRVARDALDLATILGFVSTIVSYGAYLAGGSEYSNYGTNVSLEKLKDFHKCRLQVLVEAGPDILAFETIPNKLEAHACAELLEEENIKIPSWICFRLVYGINSRSGESFKECFDVLNTSSKVTAVGINCAPPHFVQSLIQTFKQYTKKVIVVYPNSGETWDGITKKWKPSKCFDNNKFDVFTTNWRDSGAKLKGGCCQTTPTTI